MGDEREGTSREDVSDSLRNTTITIDRNWLETIYNY